MLELTEQQTQELLNSLAEIPAKWSLNLIGSIRTLWEQQNKKDEIAETEESK